MSRHTAALVLALAALAAVAFGQIIVALFLADVAIIVLALPRYTDLAQERRDAYRRNHPGRR